MEGILGTPYFDSSKIQGISGNPFETTYYVSNSVGLSTSQPILGSNTAEPIEPSMDTPPPINSNDSPPPLGQKPIAFSAQPSFVTPKPFAAQTAILTMRPINNALPIIVPTSQPNNNNPRPRLRLVFVTISSSMIPRTGPIRTLSYISLYSTSAKIMTTFHPSYQRVRLCIEIPKVNVGMLLFDPTRQSAYPA